MRRADTVLAIHQDRGASGSERPWWSARIAIRQSMPAATMDPRYEWFTGEPDASKVRKSGSEGGSGKPAYGR
jgi:hypothetical protein